MNLSAYAKKLGLSYQMVWNHYKAGLIPNARKIPSGIILIDDEERGMPERTAVYARVSSSENKTNLISQSKRVQDFCTAKGWIVSVASVGCISAARVWWMTATPYPPYACYACWWMAANALSTLHLLLLHLVVPSSLSLTRY